MELVTARQRYGGGYDSRSHCGLKCSPRRGCVANTAQI